VSTFLFADLHEILFVGNFANSTQSMMESHIYCWTTNDFLNFGGDISSEIQKITIYGLTGEIVNQVNQALTSAIALNNLPKGIYFVKLNNQTLKFVR